LERLEALENPKQNVYAPPKPPALSLYLVGFFGGKSDANASPFENYYHALGCENANEFSKLDAEQVAERHRNAMGRIFKRRGIDLDTASPGEIDAVFMKLVKKLAKSGMPVPEASWLAMAA
jgi:hypothetical protein